MKTEITFSNPDQRFWEDYADLWENSSHKSVFQAPSFLRYLAQKFDQTLAVYHCYQEQKLMGVVFLRNDDGIYKLLSEIKADYNFITIRKDCTKEETESFFRSFFEEIKTRGWALILNYQPSWAGYLKVMKQQGKTSKLYLDISKHSICPFLETETPGGILEWFNGLKNFRYYVNRLKKQQNADFEVFTSDEDLDLWVEQFCICHVKRWKGTTSPSVYNRPEKQELLKNAFRTWAKDGLLTRFSIRIGEERVAFNVALRQGNALVGHTQAYDLDFAKFSPGKALMYFIGEWMSKNNFVKIDFGKGGEAYKFGMTNGELELYKIFVSSYTNLAFILKSKMESTARSNSGFIAIYRGKIKPKIQAAKINMMTKVSKLFLLLVSSMFVQLPGKRSESFSFLFERCEYLFEI
ncbi:MAG: GNAT family N-acetyltransferase [Lewinellaceae bacterium]|nr:GNAT family N-acetyltransferase [Lewinellaceae bacterium]